MNLLKGPKYVSCVFYSNMLFLDVTAALKLSLRLYWLYIYNNDVTTFGGNPNQQALVFKEFKVTATNKVDVLS